MISLCAPAKGIQWYTPHPRSYPQKCMAIKCEGFQKGKEGTFREHTTHPPRVYAWCASVLCLIICLFCSYIVCFLCFCFGLTIFCLLVFVLKAESDHLHPKSAEIIVFSQNDDECWRYLDITSGGVLKFSFLPKKMMSADVITAALRSKKENQHSPADSTF